MDYPEIKRSERCRQLYVTLYNRLTVSYDWKELLTPDCNAYDRISENVHNNFETILYPPLLRFRDEMVPHDVKERGYQILKELRKQPFQLDQKRIDEQFKKIGTQRISFELTRVDDHTLETYKLDDNVECKLDNYSPRFQCHRNDVTQTVQKLCLELGWPVSTTKFRVDKTVHRNRIKFVSYFNATYTIEMFDICNTLDYEAVDHDEWHHFRAQMIVIHNHRNNYFLILGCGRTCFHRKYRFWICSF